MITLPLPAVDAARSGWLFYSGKDAKTVPASLRRAPVRSLFAPFVQAVGRLPCKQDVGGSNPSGGSISTALADGGFNYLLVFALSSLGRWCNASGIFLR